jgi:hypothetical protein
VFEVPLPAACATDNISLQKNRTACMRLLAVVLACFCHPNFSFHVTAILRAGFTRD